MRLIIYIFLISQLLNFLGVFAEKVKKKSSELNSVRWEKVKEKNSINLEANIIWEPYENDEMIPRKNPAKNNSEKNLRNNQKIDIKKLRLKRYQMFKLVRQ